MTAAGFVATFLPEAFVRNDPTHKVGFLREQSFAETPDDSPPPSMAGPAAARNGDGR